MNTSTSPLCRIVYAPKSRDGWLGKTLPHGKVCFFSNINSLIDQLEAGQLWAIEIEQDHDRYFIGRLTDQVKVSH